MDLSFILKFYLNFFFIQYCVLLSKVVCFSILNSQGFPFTSSDIACTG